MGSCFSIEISADTLFSSLQNCFCKKAEYIFELEKNLDALKIELQKLNEFKSDVERRVEDGERELHMIRTNQVQGWLTRVQIVTTAVAELENNSSEEFQKLCFGGYCSKNFMSSYRFGKEISEKRENVAALMAEIPGVVVDRVAEAPVIERPIDPTLVGMQSIFDKVWRCITEEEAGIIGIYGMGGVGKTALLTKINNKFKDSRNGFDVIRWVTVSNDLKLEKIQMDIGKKLGLRVESWEEKGFEEKTSEIFHVLKTKKFVLLLDDVWDRVDLTKLGVPLPSSEIASKVVFTTRTLDVCGSMGAHKEFNVECLNNEKAWELFQKMVGRETIESHPNIPMLAKTLCKECGGLPLALVTIGRGMAFKRTPDDWNYIIQNLKRSVYDFPGTDKIYPLLKVSYDCLPDDITRSCFLYCALFPEDYSIKKEMLINLWISEEFLKMDEGSFAHYRGRFIINSLIGACLLEKVREDHSTVKMHDVIRDLALWIATKVEREKENFLVQSGVGLTDAPMIGNDKEVKRVSLMDNQIKSLREIPSCPKLLTLFLNHNKLETILNGFFQYMLSIKVLDLSWNWNLMELPLPISKLTSLRHLDISRTLIRELPIEFKGLVNLIYLDVYHVTSLKKIPIGLLSSFSKLNVLRISGYFANEEENNVLYGGGELLLEEILCLEHLHELATDLSSSNALQKLLSSHKLKTCINNLGLSSTNEISSLELSSLIELENLEALGIFEYDYVKFQRLTAYHGFHKLFHLTINLCSKLKDLTWLIFFPNLEELFVINCHDIEEIISDEKLGQVSERRENLHPISNLKVVELEGLKRLRSICSTVLSVPDLAILTIRDCPELKKLPLDANSVNSRNRLEIRGRQEWWDGLQWNDEATRNAFLPCFETCD